jgi:hypothetical protein
MAHLMADVNDPGEKALPDQIVERESIGQRGSGEDQQQIGVGLGRAHGASLARASNLSYRRGSGGGVSGR